MPGGRFGGAGATGYYPRRSSYSGRWSRGRGGLYTRRPRSSGGNNHMVSTVLVQHDTSEDTPVRSLTWLLHPGYWLDKQGDYFEGKIDATELVHGFFRYETWSITYVAGVQLFIPIAFALAIVPWYDNVGNGNPQDFYPTQIPYLFHRDYGHWETDSASPDYTPNAPMQRPRIIHRDWWLSDATDLAYGNAGKVITHSWTLRKRIRIPNSHGLAIVWNAWNSNVAYDVSFGWRVGCTIGYRHRVSAP